MRGKPDPPGEFFWEGVLDQALGEETERHLAEQQAAREANPFDPRPCFHLGLLYRMQRRSKEAVEMLERALALDPGFASAHRALGEMHAVEGDYPRAWAHAREAARLGDPGLLEQLRRYPQATTGGSGRPTDDNETG